MKIELKHKILNDKYTEYVYDAYDIQNKEESNVIIDNNIKVDEFDWNIGVIYGGSGTGKSTLLKTFGEIAQPIFDNEKSLISNFDWMTPEEATHLLSAMGLSSVPCWLRPHATLSNGEQYRANLAYCVAKAKENDVILIDEYTSVVDRDVAKAMSNALQKFVRREKKKIILASCHFDIMEWLNPDWIYSPNKRRVERPDCLRLTRPKIKLEIFRCRYETWKIFKQHHYLSEDLNPACFSYVILWNDKPVSFMAILPFPGVGDAKTRRISRIVTLPDYQGLGIGKALVDYFSALYWKVGSQMYIRTINPALGISLTKDKKNWQPTLSNMKADFAKDTSGRKLLNRPSYSFKYIGEKSTDSENVIIFNADAWKDVSQLQQSLF
jgi:ABC-type lipoprotein export system ATPase subunit/GNAT superfamily N-acetyltransferase